MHAGDGGGGQVLEDVVAIAHRVEAVRRDGGEAEIAGERLAVDREGRAGERGGAERQHVGAGGAGGEPLAVALEHEHVGEQMVGEHDGLRALHVRVAGHRRVAMPLGARDQRRLHRAQPRAGCARPRP